METAERDEEKGSDDEHGEKGQDGKNGREKGLNKQGLAFSGNLESVEYKKKFKRTKVQSTG